MLHARRCSPRLEPPPAPERAAFKAHINFNRSDCRANPKSRAHGFWLMVVLAIRFWRGLEQLSADEANRVHCSANSSVTLFRDSRRPNKELRYCRRDSHWQFPPGTDNLQR